MMFPVHIERRDRAEKDKYDPAWEDAFMTGHGGWAPQLIFLCFDRLFDWTARPRRPARRLPDTSQFRQFTRFAR